MLPKPENIRKCSSYETDLKEISPLSGHQTSNKLKHYSANDVSKEILSNSIMYYFSVKKRKEMVDC